jgi:hypothetical protein
MTYQQTVTLLQNICEGINPTGSFVHGRRADASLEYAGHFPQVHLYPFTVNIDTQETYFETCEILMAFWLQDSPETSLEQRRELITQADALCRNFIKQLLATQAVQISNLRTEPQYRTLSATLSGYALSFTLSSKTSVC